MSDSETVLPEGQEAPPPGVRVMAVMRWLLVLAMAVIAAVSVRHYFEAQQSDARLFYCPMHPEVVQHGPGECPICHMTLVVQGGDDTMPREPTGGAAALPPGLAPIELSADRIQRIGLRTAPVTRGALVPSVRAVGTVATSEAGQAQVSTRFAGWIETIAVKQTWQKVEQGDVLATIYSQDLVAAQQEYVNALAWADAPQPPSLAHGRDGHDGGASAGAEVPDNRLAASARARLELLGLTRADLARLEKTRTPLRALELRAPTSGYITQRNAVRGSFVEPGTPLFEIANLATVWVQADVYERDLARVAVGQPARFTVTAYPDAAWTGTVDFLSPVIDPSTRTLRVRLVFANKDLRLKPGMYGDVAIELPPQEGLLVPREAVVDTGDSQYVFLASAGGRFEPRLVRVGARVGDAVELLPAASGAEASLGIAEGDLVVTSASFLLDSESRLRATRAAAGSASP